MTFRNEVNEKTKLFNKALINFNDYFKNEMVKDFEYNDDSYSDYSDSSNPDNEWYILTFFYK